MSKFNSKNYINYFVKFGNLKFSYSQMSASIDLKCITLMQC